MKTSEKLKKFSILEVTFKLLAIAMCLVAVVAAIIVISDTNSNDLEFLVITKLIALAALVLFTALSYLFFSSSKLYKQKRENLWKRHAKKAVSRHEFKKFVANYDAEERQKEERDIQIDIPYK